MAEPLGLTGSRPTLVQEVGLNILWRKDLNDGGFLSKDPYTHVFVDGVRRAGFLERAEACFVHTFPLGRYEGSAATYVVADAESARAMIRELLGITDRDAETDEVLGTGAPKVETVGDQESTPLPGWAADCIKAIDADGGVTES
jgi:hypothetical protein